MTEPDWKEITSVPPEHLVDPALELPRAVQLVASAGQTFAELRGDDSHRAMTWDARLRAFVGVPFAGPYPFRMALRPEDLTLVLLDRLSETLGSLPLVGVTLDEAYEWMSIGMATYLGGAPPRIERPEYDIPDHPVRTGRFTGGAEAALYGGMALLIAELVEGRDDASQIRCWPHHFDIGTLLALECDARGNATKSIAVGLAPMGGGYPSWYLYVSPWPAPRPQELPPLDAGVWHTDGWTGAVLTGAEVAALADEERPERVRAFLRSSVAAALLALGN
jgi:hypothetical protein